MGTDPATPDPPPPLYATRFMPPVRLSYDMRRGAVSGTAELVWQPGSGQYALDLSTKVLGAEVLGLSSRGSFDSAGLAPRRFTDRRRGRDRLAADTHLQHGQGGSREQACGRQRCGSGREQCAAAVPGRPSGPGNPAILAARTVLFASHWRRVPAGRLPRMDSTDR